MMAKDGSHTKEAAIGRVEVDATAFAMMTEPSITSWVKRLGGRTKTTL